MGNEQLTPTTTSEKSASTPSSDLPSTSSSGSSGRVATIWLGVQTLISLAVAWSTILPPMLRAVDKWIDGGPWAPAVTLLVVFVASGMPLALPRIKDAAKEILPFFRKG